MVTVALLDNTDLVGGARNMDTVVTFTKILDLDTIRHRGISYPLTEPLVSLLILQEL
jgi:hypothetical protein